MDHIWQIVNVLALLIIIVLILRVLIKLNKKN